MIFYMYRIFLTAARCLNFTEAAQQLFITQPALSQQITAIEAELNMQLFIRHKNKRWHSQDWCSTGTDDDP